MKKGPKTSRRPKMTPEEWAVSKLEASRKGRITQVKAKQLNPIVVGGALRRASEVTIIPARELDTLKIDSSYQRAENRELVNQLLAVLEAGGMVPDPITVVVRPDGTRWIVDGQQRWAAHYLAMKPVAAVLYFVDTMDEERRLFTVLNTYRRPAPSIRMRAWTGPSSELVKWLAGSPASPILGELSFAAAGGATKYAAPTVLRGIAAALGVSPSGGSQNGTEEFMRTLDRVYMVDPKRAIRVAGVFLGLAKTIFATGRLRHTPLLALGMACAERWGTNGTCEMPSKAALYNLKRLNWTNPSATERNRWLPVLKADILRRWPK